MEKLETNHQLIQNIKDWIKIDNEIMQLKNDTKIKTLKKKTLTADLIEVMKTNKIDCFNITDGNIIYKKNKLKKPINGKSLLKILESYYKNDDNSANDLTTYILNNRETEIKETIKLKIIT